MRTILTLFTLLCVVPSCRVIKSIGDHNNHYVVVITDIRRCDSTRYSSSRGVYEIGVRGLYGNKVLYARDYFGDIHEDYHIGDTVTVAVFK